jgi:ribose 5-phosphate isomerase B
MRVGIAADHAVFAIKKQLTQVLREFGHEVRDFGPSSLTPADDYSDYVVSLARDVARGGVGARVAANKVKGVRAALVHDICSAPQGAEDDDRNVICFGARVIGYALAWDLTEAFLAARFTDGERHLRRLGKVSVLET